MQMAFQGIEDLLRACCVRAHLATPVLVVWPSDHSGSFHQFHLQRC